MFEETEVCMLCGRPVDGRVYCSSECEALDSTSPSASSASSAYPSPYLTSMKGQGNFDVPALVPSTLGHRTHHSISSSSNSSTSWSVVTDEEEGDPYVYSSESADMFSDGSKSPGYNSRLCYARRPSTTNHRATVPMLNRHTSSSASSLGVPRSVPSPFYASTEDDASSLCISELSLHDESEREGTPSQRRKRNRASLPAYFSLLQGASAGASSPSSSRARRAPSALQTVSRSLQASPTTPKVAHATVSFANAEAHIANTPRGRGRRRERDPDGRSNSSRRETARSPLRHHHLSAVQRARIDSVEKVVEWVSSSPVVNIPGRRNSSPPRKPKYEFVEALTQGLRDCAIASDDEDDDQVLREKDAARAEYERTLRGRRRAEELDVPFRGDAPGIGNGRSGLKARERGRALTGRAIGIVHR